MMTEATDGPSVVHGDPVVQRGFAQIPMAVMEREDLSVGAKLVYAYLKHMAWRQHGAEAETPLAEISRVLRISAPTARGYIRQLADAPRAEGDDPTTGRLLTSTQRGLGLSNVYTIYDPLTKVSNGKQVSSLPASKEPSDFARARSLLGVDVKAKTEELSPDLRSGGLGEDPPAVPEVFKIGKIDPCFDAIVDVCGIDPASPRQGDVAAALYGRPHARSPHPGIRDLFWTELVRYAASRERLDELRELTPERYATLLVEQIRRKAMTWTESSDATLTPTALRKYWFEPDAFRARTKFEGTSIAEIADRAVDG